MQCKKCQKVFPLSQMTPKSWYKVIPDGRTIEINGWRCLFCA